ncbi:dynamin family protein [Leifsonia sp. YIM 134122]|uniref:Dynamin family protein n=1 Tax=Leifsonia stereocauli TaxID=3134136 RepID=A0ABU9W0K7_9MICO
MTKAAPAASMTSAPGDDTSSTAMARANQQLVHLVEKTADLSGALGRADLVGRLEQTRARLNDPYVRVIVVGQFKQGKSKLVNALVNAPACPVDDDIATSVPTSVSYAEEPAAYAIIRDGNSPTGGVERLPIPLDSLADFVSERGTRSDEHDIVGAEVVLPRELLRGGLRLVDSPGVGGIESTRSVSTLAALSTAHAVLLVSDASQEYTEPEVQFLKHALRVSPNVAAVLSKTDIYPSWRQIEEIDRSHLGDIGRIPMFAVSSDLRMLAAQEQDRALNEESGFPALVAHLRRDVLDRAEIVHRRAAVHDLASVVDQLGMAVKTELNALLNPQDTPAMIADLESAKARADEFRSRSSRWQVTLSDGIADLISDTEHDLRDRLRKVQRDAEVAIDEGDPGPIWDQIAEWLDQRVANAVSETFVWTNDRSRWLSEQVAEEFSLEESTIPFIDVSDTEGVLDPVEHVQGMDAGQLGATEKIYIGLRGSYSGVLMAGLAMSLIGVALINPVSLVVGVLVGRRAYREDKTARLSRRQAEAKNLTRRHIDDVVFQVGKQLKDRLRFVQRVARDHFGGIADQLHRSLSDSVLAAKQAAATFESDRNGRVIELRRQLAHIESLRAEIPASVDGSEAGR